VKLLLFEIFQKRRSQQSATSLHGGKNTSLRT
jgi:hypothetical protein